ncbi:hypothetical protein BSQ33_16060 [Vibrio gazogenes]|uniref:Uncharacterized protein n=1 Tax=Vibrio gazogenes TaxID=687 RepID=A0A1Z2SJD2_VIBGA|nr:hypothetical protein BSQ33_16060 [Vibrio gazogenes]
MGFDPMICTKIEFAYSETVGRMLTGTGKAQGLVIFRKKIRWFRMTHRHGSQRDTRQDGDVMECAEGLSRLSGNRCREHIE